MNTIDYSARYDERIIKKARVRAQKEAVCEIIGSAAVMILLTALVWLGFAL